MSDQQPNSTSQPTPPPRERLELAVPQPDPCKKSEHPRGERR